MLTGDDVTAALEACGLTHVVWIPDTHLGTWEPALEASASLQLLRACREGEALAIAGGLLLGGARPIVVIQCTGLFEAGDALRNLVHDLELPLLLLVGVRGYLGRQPGPAHDNCPWFTEPFLRAWQLPFTLLDPTVASGADLVTAVRQQQDSRKAGVILLAE